MRDSVVNPASQWKNSATRVGVQKPLYISDPSSCTFLPLHPKSLVVQLRGGGVIPLVQSPSSAVPSKSTAASSQDGPNPSAAPSRVRQPALLPERATF